MRFLIALTLLFGTALAQDDDAQDSIERRYCTQQGPFILRFDPDKAAGIYAILANDHLGVTVGSLDGFIFEGTWYELDTTGPIRLEFSDDWSSFEATYATAPDKEPWRTGWTGYLPPAGHPVTFEIGGETFRCR
jgi:hypothetical protein